MPTLKFHGKLNWLKCHDLYERRRSKSKHEASVGPKGAYHIVPIERYYGERPDGCAVEGYALRMYQTRILQYFRDGAIKLVYHDSNTTRRVLWSHGPVQLFNDSQSKYREQVRWRPKTTNWRDPSYPLDGTLFIDPQGYVNGLVDYRRRIRPGCRAERSRIMREFRQKALGRFVLGEFSELCTEYKKAQWGDAKYWAAWVPQSRENLFNALMAEDIDEALRIWRTHRASPVYGAWGRSEQKYATREQAAAASMNAILRQPMNDDKWYDYETINYPPIKAT